VHESESEIEFESVHESVIEFEFVHESEFESESEFEFEFVHEFEFELEFEFEPDSSKPLRSLHFRRNCLVTRVASRA
jgi:hypothetical protein